MDKTYGYPKIQVYSITCYVEAEKAAKELGVRYRGGFFETEQDFCDAIMDGAFGKAFQVLQSMSFTKGFPTKFVYKTMLELSAYG